MKYTTSFAVGALLLGQALTHPVSVSKRCETCETQNIDTTVLQFALTLEHLENAFYQKALLNLSEQQFIDAGYDAKYYTDIKYIASDEASHVMALTAALKEADVEPNMACEYAFPFTDVPSFITLSSVLEGVGTSAYLGAAPLITSKEYLTVAGSVLAVEALHTSLQRSARHLAPAANPYYPPLSPNPVFTLAASFITSCPASNAKLPFNSFPGLTVVETDSGRLPLAMNMSATFTVHEEGGAEHQDRFITFVSGIMVKSVPAARVQDASTISFTATIPEGVAGQSYAFLTSQAVDGGPGALTDEVILNGPAVVEVTPSAPMALASSH